MPAKRKPSPTQLDPAVEAFLTELDHPLKWEIESARAVILGVSPAIGEGIKWKAPSFRTAEFFATVNLRAADGVQIIFHLGAKKRELAGADLHVPDPAGLVKWLAKDRFLLSLGTGKAFDKNRPALADIVRAWLPFV